MSFVPPSDSRTRKRDKREGYYCLLLATVIWLLLFACGMRSQTPSNSLTAPWQPLGPTSVTSITYGQISGRITALALDPADTTGNTLYAGTTGGGVWKSTNAAGPLAAITFTPLTDTLPVFAASSGSSIIPSLAIGALAISNGILLAGTGDPNNAADSYYGEGLLRSTDGGLTWTLVQGSQDGANGNHSFLGLATAGLAFSTTTPALAVAAFTTSAEGTIVNSTNTSSIPGLYYSTDAGVTWQMATIQDGSQIVQTPQPLGTGQAGNAVTAVVWDALRNKFFAAIRSHGYYASPDGITWTRLTAQPGTGLSTANCPVGVNGQGSANCPVYRGALAVQPATGDLYALTVDANSRDQGIWQDLCGAASGACATPTPAFATRIDNAALEVGSGSTAITQGSYNLTLAAAPTAGGTILFAGTIDLYRCPISSNSTSCTLRNSTNALNGCNAPAAVAPAQHALAILSQSTGIPLLFLGNDGGLWRSLDGVAETGSACAATDVTHFDNLNPALASGGSLAEIVGFAQDPTDPNTLLAGLGENGSAATSAASSLSAWPQLSAGEGGYPQLDSNTPANWSLAIGAGVNLAQCTLGASCTAANFLPPATVGGPQVALDVALLDAPTLLDPALTTSVLLATCRVWRGSAASGSAWTAANAISPAFNASATPCTSSSPLIRSIAAGGPGTTSANLQNAGSTVIYAGLAGTLDSGASIAGHLFFTKSAGTANSTAAWTDLALSPVTNATAGFNPGSFDVSAIAVDPHDATGATVYVIIAGFDVPLVYRSTDFGAHWSNVSANLPSAPANAVLIDPNDANTVYLALDTGVYVTTAISTCASTNCWSLLGTSLPNSPVTSLAAAANMLTGDGRRGMLRAGTYGRGLWQTPLLTAIALAQPAIQLSANSFSFADTQVSTQSAAQTLTVTSNGNAPVTMSSLLFSGDFATTSDQCSGKTLAINATCTIQILFAPTATGPRSGQLTIYANVPGGQAVVTLTGNGTTPASIVFTPPSLGFAATLVNQTTTAQIISVANNGGTTATLQMPVITGDFAISANTCGSTLGASSACSLSITFTPTASGTRYGSLSLSDSAGTQVAQLTGTGNANATDTLSATSLNFAAQQLNTQSPSQPVTMTNAGDVALALINVSVTAGDFTAVSACGTSLAAHSTCAVSVNFIPTATGTRNATLTVADQFRSQTVALTGTGVAPAGVSLSPASLAFSPTGVSLNAVAQAVTLTNNGGLPLTISSTTISPGFAVASSTCTATLAANAACTLQVTFSPVAAGPIAGALTLTDNALSTTQSVTLSGTGIDFTLAPTGATSMTISSGSTVTYPLQLSSLAGLSGNVALACTGAPAHSTCTIAPSTATLGGDTTLVVTVATGLSYVALQRAPLPWRQRFAPVFTAFALPLLWFTRRRKLRRTLLPLLALALLVTTSGCGAGRTIPGDGNPIATTPTPSGTYNLNVSASSAGLTRNVGLTLIVQ